MTVFVDIAAFYTQRPGNYSICLSGENIFSYYVFYENVAKYSRVKRQTDRDKCTEAIFS